MDIAKALRLGEIAKEVQQLELALALAKAGQANGAWITAIYAVDEGECERSIIYPIPAFKEIMRQEGQDPAMKALRQQAREETAQVFAILEKAFAARLAAKQAEMEGI